MVLGWSLLFVVYIALSYFAVHLRQHCKDEDIIDPQRDNIGSQSYHTVRITANFAYPQKGDDLLSS